MYVQAQTRWYHLLYPMFVLSLVTFYVVFAIVPFFATGVYRFSYQEISSQAGTPSYPFDGLLKLGGIFSTYFLPWFSLLPGMFILATFPSEQDSYSRFERRIINWTLLAHIVMLTFIWTYGHRIFIWIAD